ncbi:hypothetical protein SAMN05660971_00135 [Halomonas cupida]|uniref:Uncharacterized protein n=1 Tax=Halomonas cupida TaxID=44933 RepID=A0A1M6ZIY3_9GAMM|nr:hypothetical protein SAMN05660971_00135 [Halomonas cupida]
MMSGISVKRDSSTPEQVRPLRPMFDIRIVIMIREDLSVLDRIIKGPDNMAEFG